MCSQSCYLVRVVSQLYSIKRALSGTDYFIQQSNLITLKSMKEDNYVVKPSIGLASLLRMSYN